MDTPSIPPSPSNRFRPFGLLVSFSASPAQVAHWIGRRAGDPSTTPTTSNAVLKRASIMMSGGRDVALAASAVDAFAWEMDCRLADASKECSYEE